MDTERRMTTEELAVRHRKSMDEARRLETGVMVTEQNWNAVLRMQNDLFLQMQQLNTDLKMLLTKQDAQESLTEMQMSAENFEKQAGSLSAGDSSACKELTESTQKAVTLISENGERAISTVIQEAKKKIHLCAWVSITAVILCTAKGAKVGRGIYNKDGTSALEGGESEAALQYKRAILAAGKSKLVSRPIKPIDDSLQVYELPQSFTREDLQRLRESKQNIAEDTEAYEQEHKNDKRYVDYNKQFEEREKALQEETDKKGRKKKRKPPKMLGE